MSLNDELREALLDELTEPLDEARVGDPLDVASETDRVKFVDFASKAMEASLGKQLRKRFPDLSERMIDRITTRAADGFAPRLGAVLRNIGRPMAAKRLRRD